MDRGSQVVVVAVFAVLWSCSVLPCAALPPATNYTKKLIWSQSPLSPIQISRLLKIEGDPSGWVGDPMPPVQAVSSNVHEWGSMMTALGFSYRRRLLVWSEAVNGQIESLCLDKEGSHPTKLFSGTSSQVNGVTVDWINDNVYWTDGLYNWLIMAPLLRRPSAKPSQLIYRILVQDGLDNPHGVAVLPGKNWILLSDGGLRPRIERMDLLGRSREALVDKDILAPRALVIDMQGLRLFWVDVYKGTVESVCLRGKDPQRSVIFTGTGHKFYGMAFFQNYLFLTDQAQIDLKILSVDEDSSKIGFDRTREEEERGGEDEEERQEEREDSEEDKKEKKRKQEEEGKLRGFPLGNKPFGIVMFDRDQQPGFVGGCEKLGCEHMCVEREWGRAECVCGEGYDLLDDMVQCVEEKEFLLPAHLYTMGIAVCMYPAHVADMSMSNVSLTSQCGTLNDNVGYLALTFHSGRNLLFFSGNVTHSIYSMRMEVGAQPKVIVSGTGVVKGLAMDWVTDTLFWTDSSRGHLLGARLDGSFQRVLLQEDIHRPLGIAVHPRRGKIYWTDTGIPSKESPRVESANMDGSERRSLVAAKDLGQPNHLFIDYRTDRLYWADSVKNQVVSYDLNEDTWTVFFSSPRASFYGVTLYKDYLLWTDTQSMNGIHMARVDILKKVRGIIHPGYGEAADIITVDKALQPDMASPCKNSRALCDQLCLPRGPDNHTCRCGLGFTLQGGMVCAYGDFLKDNFLLVTDANQRNVYQIDVSSDDIRAVTRGERHQPAAIAFLPGLPGTVLWSDNEAHVIRRKELGLGWTSTFLDLPENSKVQGLAIDSVHRLMYYTDPGLDVIGVVQVGGSNPLGHAHIITDDLFNPWDIVVYVPDKSRDLGKIFFTDWAEEPTLNEASMFGRYRRKLITFSSAVWPSGLTLDRRGQALYWTSGLNNNLEVYHMASGQHQIVLSVPTPQVNSLFLMGGFIYMADSTKRFLLRVPKVGNTSEVKEVGEGRFNTLNGITGYNATEMPQGQGEGICAVQGRCGEGAMCLPRTFLTYHCICVLGYFPKGGFCVRSTSTTAGPGKHNSSMSLQHLRGHLWNETESHKASALTSAGNGSLTAGIVVTAIIGFAVFCAAAAAGVFCYYRRHQQYPVPHSRLGGDNNSQADRALPTAPPPQPPMPSLAAAASLSPARGGPARSRVPAALAHLKVFYARRPSAEQVRIEEGFDNPSYNEAATTATAAAAVAMMGRGQSVASSEDNQPTL